MALAITGLRWTLGASGLALGGYIIVLQMCAPLWRLWARGTSRPARSYSYVPLLGPLLFQAGAWLIPVRRLRPYGWLGWVLDPGTWVLLFSLPFLIRDYRNYRASVQKQ